MRLHQNQPTDACYPAAFAVEMDALPGETVLRLRGELDARTQQMLLEALDRVEHGVARIVVDLVDLTSIDAGNLGVLHRSQMVANLRGSQLILRSPNPHIARILKVTGLHPDTEGDERVRPIALPLPSWVHDRPNGQV